MEAREDKDKDKDQVIIAVDIQNLTTSVVDKRFIKKVIRETLRYTQIKGIISVGIVLVSRPRMREINKKYRNKCEAADILSFGADNQFVSFPDAGKYLGEMVVCISEIKNRAAGIGISFNKELAHIIIHGTLHLLGWKHGRSSRDAKKMHSKEEEIMSLIL